MRFTLLRQSGCQGLQTSKASVPHRLRPILAAHPARLQHSTRSTVRALATEQEQRFTLIDASVDGDDSTDLVAAVRRKSAPKQMQRSSRSPLSEFFLKCAAAYRIFFPQRARDLSPKDEGRNRLRMILVADRCAMSPASLNSMKSSVVAALSEYVDVEAEELVEVTVTTDEQLGTIYGVSVPVKRVKPLARIGVPEEDEEGVTEVEWDSEDKDSDPSSRFPYGT